MMQMDSGKLNQIIQLALQKGILSEEDIDLIKCEQPTIAIKSGQTRLDRLLSLGLLSEVMLQALQKELEARHLDIEHNSIFGPITNITRITDANKREPVTESKLTPELTLQISPQNINKEPATQIDAAAQADQSEQIDPQQDPLATMAGNTGSFPAQRRRIQHQTVGRYQLIKLLGEGGMGAVYQAYDPALKRNVALKFLHCSDEESVRRLLMEGRAQARIEHPNVCRVYEVDKVEDQIYIAMQYIDGDTLNVAMHQMNMEQKVKVIVDIADGLHCAHKESLIHRDIKPHNILIEKMPDGSWKPFIMDFGLAREISQKGITVTGEVLGTPCYMAPEQARGKIEDLDRRTDVYSLGATLYELLLGRPPFEGDDVMQLLLKVMNEDVQPLRKVMPHCPVDLETIVMKCLEKEPQQRYDSAKALEEDLLRYLADEPITGKPASWSYRLLKQVRRHKAIVAVSLVAFIVVVIAAGTTLRTRLVYAERSRLAQQFGEQVKEIENIMRHGHMLPLHDISREEGLVDRQMHSVRETLKVLGETSEGPGEYALGRGYEAVGNYERAREHLELAWQKGYQEPEAAYSLGFVLGKLYQRRIAEIEQQIENRELREIDRQQAEIQLKRPALTYLALGRNAVGESPEYVEALIALYEGNWEEALKKAEEANNQVPWLYEAKRLIGDVYQGIGNEKREKGDIIGARQSYQQAREAYELAVRIGNSDVNNYESLSLLWVRIMALNFYQGENIDEPLQQLIDTAEKGLKANRRWIDGHTQKALAYFISGQFRSVKLGEEPLNDYGKAIEEAKRAIKISPDNVNAYNMLGNAHLMKGKFLLTRSIDPLESLDQSINAYGNVLQIDGKQLTAYINIGNANLIKGQYQYNLGKDPTLALEQARENCQKVLQLNNQFYLAYSTLGQAGTIKGQYQLNRGIDPTVTLNEAIENLRRALEISPKNMLLYFYLSSNYIEKGRAAITRGQDPITHYEQGINNLRTATLINSNFAVTHNNIAFAYWLKSRQQLANGEDPTTTLNQVNESCEKTLSLNPKMASVFGILTSSYWVKAEYQLLKGENPLAALSTAQEYLKKSLSLNNNDAFDQFNDGMINYIRARYLQQRGQSAGNEFNLAIDAFRRATQINSALIMAYQYEARARLRQAADTINRRQSPEALLTEAKQALQSAVKIRSSDAESLQIESEILLREAEWLSIQNQNSSEKIATALQLCKKAMAQKPDLAEAYITEAALNLLAARTDSANRVQRAQTAQKSLTQARTINKLMERENRTLFDEAVRLER